MPGPDDSGRIMTFSYVSASIVTSSVCGSCVTALRRRRKSIKLPHIAEHRADSAMIMTPAAFSARIIAPLQFHRI